MDSMNNNEVKINQLILSLIEKFPRKDMPILKFYSAAMDKMSQHVWTRIYPTLPNADPMAFVKRDNESGGVYKIYVNPHVSEDIEKYLLLHEFGHVIFTHIELPVMQEQILINKIMYFWPELSKYFQNSEYMSSYAVEDFAHSILNIAQDLEVNGKLFTKQEWDVFCYNSQIEYAKAQFYSPKIKLEEKIELLKWLQQPESDRPNIFLGWHPSQYHFPVGLDYSQYVELIIHNQEIFFKELTNSVLSTMGMEARNNSGDKLTTEQIDKLRNQANDTTTDILSEQAQEIEETLSPDEIWHGSGGFSATGKIKIKKNRKGNGFGYSSIDINDTHKLEQFILKNCYSKSILNTHNDTMYYYNRRKYNSNLLISKQTQEELYRPGNIYLLIDCSGSISAKSIEIMVKLIQRLANNLQKNSRIIWWSTELNGDYALRNAKGPNGSGGTDIAKGIEYVRKNYLKNSNDKLIIISDFYDSQYHWYNELIKIRNDCMGICWTYQTINENQFYDYIKTCGSNTLDITNINKFMSVLPSVCVTVH